MSGFGNIGPFADKDYDPFDMRHRRLPPDIEKEILQGIIPDIGPSKQPKKSAGDKKPTN